MLQIARNLTDAEAGFLRRKQYLLMDRDVKFSQAFRDIMEQTGLKAVRLPPQSPNLNPNLERFMRSVKEEWLDRIIFFRGEGAAIRHNLLPLAFSFGAKSPGGSRTGWFKLATQSVAQPVRSSAASDSVACCDITTIKPRDFVPDPHRTSGCVTVPGVSTLQWPTIWLITNHRPIACKYPVCLETYRSKFRLP